MKNIAIILAVFLGLVSFQSCSSGSNKLEAKKEELKKLKKELVKIQGKITALEQEIEKLDTTRKERKYNVRLTTLSATNFVHRLNLQGTAESDALIKVSAEIPGKVVKVYVKEGQRVKKGQALFKVDDKMLKDKLNEVKTRYELAKTVYEKQKRLWEQKIGSEIQYLQAKNNKEALEKTIKTLETQISKTLVRAPISGRIEELNIKEGENAPPGMPLIFLLGPGKQKIRVKVPENYLEDVNVGDRVLVRLPESGKEFYSKVITTDKSVHPMLRTFDVIIAVPRGVSLSPNQAVKVSIEDYAKKNSLAIPINIIQKDEHGNYFVFVAEKDGQGKLRAKKRILKTGKIDGKNIEILEGLKPGDQLIVEGHLLISDGFLLNPVK